MRERLSSDEPGMSVLTQLPAAHSHASPHSAGQLCPHSMQIPHVPLHTQNTQSSQELKVQQNGLCAVLTGGTPAGHPEEGTEHRVSEPGQEGWRQSRSVRSSFALQRASKEQNRVSLDVFGDQPSRRSSSNSLNIGTPTAAKDAVTGTKLARLCYQVRFRSVRMLLQRCMQRRGHVSLLDIQSLHRSSATMRVAWWRCTPERCRTPWPAWAPPVPSALGHAMLLGNRLDKGLSLPPSTGSTQSRPGTLTAAGWCRRACQRSYGSCTWPWP